MKIGIGITLSDEVFNYVRSLELKIMQSTKVSTGFNQPPHITIKSPFQTNDLNSHLDYIKNLARTTIQFPVKMSHINYFEPSTVYLSIKQNKKLDDLHERILSDLNIKFGITPNSFEGEKMIFHSSLAINLDKKSFIKVKECCMKIDQKEVLFMANTIALFYYIDSTKEWIILNQVKLQR